MESIYDVDIKRLFRLLLPMKWRQVGIMAMVETLTSPIAGMPNELRKYKTNCECRMTYNGQVCKLRGLLNDEFDPIQRRITITDAKGDNISKRYLFIYARGMGQQVELPNKVRERHSPSLDMWDFEVNIPVGLKPQETRIKALINEYKLASKRYNINYI